jgi:hypothetical protein
VRAKAVSPLRSATALQKAALPRAAFARFVAIVLFKMLQKLKRPNYRTVR